MFFHWSLSNSKSPQVSRSLLSILAVPNNTVVWTYSKFSSPFSNPLVTVPNTPITIGIIVSCMFRSCFNSLARSRYLSFFSHSFSFILRSAGTAKSTILQILFFFFFGWLLLSLVFWPRLGDLCVCQSLMILAVFSNTVVWIDSTRPPTSKSSRPFNNPLVTVTKAPITIGTIVTFMFDSSFNSLARSRYLSFFPFPSDLFCGPPGQKIIIRSGLLAGIWWSVCMLKCHRSLCDSFSRTGAGLCIYHLFVWSNWNILHISQWITLPTQSCLVLYSFCANLLHSLIMWLIVSSLSLHSLHLLFCCVLSILTLIWLVLMALSCAAIRRDSVSLLKFPFLSQYQVFWCAMLFIRRLKRP